VSKHQDHIIAAAAAGKVSEQMFAAAVAKPRGATTAVMALDSREVMRMGMAGVVASSWGEASVKLEGTAGGMNDFAEACACAKGGVWAVGRAAIRCGAGWAAESPASSGVFECWGIR
jgi:hypothetical protein